ncbi:MAG: hypothetical protein RIG61_07755 [Deltaproteobacteria bacterium]
MPGYTEPSLKELSALFFIAFGTAVVFYDLSTIVRGLKAKKTAGGLTVKGIRVLTTLVGIILLVAAGIYGNDTLLLFGLVLGIEELYETSLVLYLLKNAR